jgi:hypothetical protein
VQRAPPGDTATLLKASGDDFIDQKENTELEDLLDCAGTVFNCTLTTGRPVPRRVAIVPEVNDIKVLPTL